MPVEQYGPSPLILRLCFAGGVVLTGGLFAAATLRMHALAYLAFIGPDLLFLSLFVSRVSLEDAAVRRTAVFGTRKIRWREVLCIRISELGFRSSAGLALIAPGSASVELDVPGGEVDATAARIVRRCPRAFIEDHRTGQIVLPHEGSAHEVREIAQALLENARESPWLKPLWVVLGVVFLGSLVSACAILVVYGIYSGEPGFIYSGAAFLVALLTLAWMERHLPDSRRMAMRSVRMYEELAAGANAVENA